VDRVSVRHEEDLAERHLRSHGGVEPLDADGFAFRDPILLAARPDDCVHGRCLLRETLETLDFSIFGVCESNRNVRDRHPDYRRPRTRSAPPLDLALGWM